MSDAVDKELAKIDHHQRTLDFAQSLGCSYEQAKVFADSQRDKFRWNGAVLSWGATGRPAADEVEAVKAHMRENKLDFLLPAEKPQDQINADPAQIEAALAGNLTAKGKLLRDTFKGDLTALETALTQRREKIKGANGADNPDHSTNPFSAKGWSISKQGQIVKAMGEAKAAQVAAAVGCTLGSTRPNPLYN